MKRSYEELVELAADLEMFRGYMNVARQQQQQKVRMAFDTARNRFVYHLLREGEDVDALGASLNAEIDEFIGLTPDWQSTLEFVRAELLNRLDKERRKKPWVRKAAYWAPVAAASAALIVYGAVRYESALTVDAPLMTALGLSQRAAALHKMVRYGELMESHVQRGGFLKPLLLWPVEPTDREIAAGKEFAAVVVEGNNLLAREGARCVAIGGDDLTDQQVQQIDSVAEALASDGLPKGVAPGEGLLVLIKRTCEAS